jgi:hypothetical protein
LGSSSLWELSGFGKFAYVNTSAMPRVSAFTGALPFQDAKVAYGNGRFGDCQFPEGLRKHGNPQEGRGGYEKIKEDAGSDERIFISA